MQTRNSIKGSVSCLRSFVAWGRHHFIATKNHNLKDEFFMGGWSAGVVHSCCAVVASRLRLQRVCVCVVLFTTALTDAAEDRAAHCKLVFLAVELDMRDSVHEGFLCFRLFQIFFFFACVCLGNSVHRHASLHA